MTQRTAVSPLVSKPDRVSHPTVLWDMTFALRSMTGTRVYTHKLYEALTELSDWNFLQVNGGAPTTARPRGNFSTSAQSVLWLLKNAERQAKQIQPDLYHSAAYLGPWRLPCPSVLNVFDTTYLAYPRHFDWKWRVYARTIIPRAIRSATAVLTLSGHARDEILKAYRVPRERVRIVAPGIGAEFQPHRDVVRLARLRAKYGLAENYLIYVGGREPRKNLPALVKAFEIVRRAYPDLQFVIAGPRAKPAENSHVMESSSAAPAIREPGFVPQEDLPALYAGARAFFYASMLEGFGMPPLEAMACGTPVVTAPNPPMPEVLGDAALFTADDSPAALAQGMLRLLSDNTLARELGARGVARAKHFTWENAARKTIEVYQELLAQSGRADA